MDINYWGVVYGTRAFLPHLIEEGSGAVVNMSSILGLWAFPTQSAYCAAKFAVRGYTEAVRQELHGTGVRAVTVHPGGVDTPITRSGRVQSRPASPRRPDLVSHDDFAAVARTSPERAAAIIHRGTAAGKARILVGADARLAYLGCHPDADALRWRHALADADLHAATPTHPLGIEAHARCGIGAARTIGSA